MLDWPTGEVPLVSQTAPKFMPELVFAGEIEGKQFQRSKSVLACSYQIDSENPNIEPFNIFKGYRALYLVRSFGHHATYRFGGNGSYSLQRYSLRSSKFDGLYRLLRTH